MKIMSPWVGCRSLHKHVSLKMICMRYYDDLWITKPQKKKAKIVRGGDFEYICPTWHVDLLLSCRKIHRNLYNVENHSRNSCWATITWISIYHGFFLTLQSDQLLFTDMTNVCCQSLILFIHKPLYIQVKLRPEENWIEGAFFFYIGIKHWKTFAYLDN